MDVVLRWIIFKYNKMTYQAGSWEYIFKAPVISHPTASELILYAFESICVTAKQQKLLVLSTFSLTALHQMHGLRAYHHCGERITSVYTEAFHGSCSLNSQIFFFLFYTLSEAFKDLFTKAHTVTGLNTKTKKIQHLCYKQRTGVWWSPTWLPSFWVLCQFDVDGLKLSEEDYEPWLRS